MAKKNLLIRSFSIISIVLLIITGLMISTETYSAANKVGFFDASSENPLVYSQYTLGESKFDVRAKLYYDSTLEVDESGYMDNFFMNPFSTLKAYRPPFIKHVFFQFFQNTIPVLNATSARVPTFKSIEEYEKDLKLYEIIVMYNEKLFTYEDLYKKLVLTYGLPAFNHADQAIWLNKNVNTPQYRLVLEKPANIKYVNMETLRKAIKWRTELKEAKENWFQFEERLLDDL